jgi:hypothetical protein
MLGALRGALLPAEAWHPTASEQHHGRARAQGRGLRGVCERPPGRRWCWLCLAVVVVVVVVVVEGGGFVLCLLW